MRDISSLKHVHRTSPTGAQIIVLDTGALIDAECEAMLQALQSRSNKSVMEHLGIVAEKGPGKFMASYYVGYGHKSIGDCGSGTVFIEGASMLAAKAFQDWFDYHGQEGSTRYMDFSTSAFIDPYGTEESKDILETSRRFYMKHMSAVIEDLARRFPRQDGEKEEAYEKAIKARAFDIMRGFLPAGTSTNFSWHMNLRQAADQLMRLRYHPLPEVRQIAEAVEDALREKYPSSFSHKRYEETESYNDDWMNDGYYFSAGVQWPEFEAWMDEVDFGEIRNHQHLFDLRPPKTELPRELKSCGNVSFKIKLDFASFRDLQRHRSVYQRMPLLNEIHGFGEWYLSELPGNVREAAVSHLEELERRIIQNDARDGREALDQYYWPMGYKTPNLIIGSLPALVYLVELRATRFVHPTLRKLAFQMAGALQEEVGIRLHLDPDPDRFDVKRGTHDIVQKV